VVTFPALVDAYFDCRRSKRNSASALAFEQNLERNLVELFDELQGGGYQPGPSICFVVTRPRPREVWAAAFRDRIVHHLLYNHVAPAIEARFVADSCACIKGRGTLYAARRLEHHVRSVTHNWSRPAHYLKLDLRNFFVSIDKRILSGLLGHHITDPWWLQLALQVLMHDPRQNFELRSTPALMAMVPPHKRLADQPAHLGLPIGNLSSQFFANVYLNELDQHIKHTLRAPHLVRYVDDFVLLHESPQWLNGAHADICAWLPANLGVQLNDRKTILQPASRGIDFVGHIIKPWHRRTRPRTVATALRRVATVPAPDLHATTNSYLGLLGQATASHHDRCLVANAARRRGLSVDMGITKTFRARA
jgi:RNA-directed DNA polymerase